MAAISIQRKIPAVSVLLVALMVGSASARNPGISLRLSEAFFSYLLKDFASPLVQEKIGSVKIPDLTSHIPYINTDIYLTDLTLDPNTYRLHPSSYLIPNTNLTGLEAYVGVYINGNGHWKTRTRWWPHISESGSVHYNTNPMWVRVAVSMHPGSNGIWNFTLLEAGAESNLEIKFTGDGMSGIDVGALRKDINKDASEAASGELTSLISTFLSDLTPMLKKYLPYISYKNCTRFGIPGCQDFALNLSLSSPGIWKQYCSAEVQLNGYLLYKGHAFLPTPAQPFPVQQGCGPHDISLFLSGGTFSSLVAAILASGLVHGNFPTNKFADDAYYDQYVPQLKKFGHLPIYANLSLLNSSMVITANEMRVQFGASFNVLIDTTPSQLLPEKKFEEAFDMVITCTVGMTAWLTNISTPDGMMALLSLNFSTARVDGVELHNSTVGDVDMGKVHALMQQLMSSAFSNADEFMAKGILIIPNHLKNVSLRHPTLVIGEGYLELAMDVGVYNNTALPTSAHGQQLSEDQLLAMEKAVSRIDPDKVPRTAPGALEAVIDGLLEMGVLIGNRAKESLLMFAQGP
eukprot:scpid33636/ scgid27698/ 